MSSSSGHSRERREDNPNALRVVVAKRVSHKLPRPCTIGLSNVTNGWIDTVDVSEHKLTMAVRLHGKVVSVITWALSR